jgi:hypothetical protein
MSEDIVLVDIVQQVTSAMQVQKYGASVGTYLTINYQPGRALDIINELMVADRSQSYKDKKYPLFGLSLPAREKKGDDFTVITVDRIVIAALTQNTDGILKRYEIGGTFKSILYPCYNEFLKRLAFHKNVTNKDPEAFVHTKFDNPASEPIAAELNDYVDVIEIRNLEIQLLKNKTC